MRNLTAEELRAVSGGQVDNPPPPGNGGSINANNNQANNNSGNGVGKIDQSANNGGHANGGHGGKFVVDNINIT